MRYRFFIADVFTDRPFGGNQLAVFPEAAGLSPDEMQAVAREFNFAETTFVVAPSIPDATARIRIFTPRRELDFAGHPTIGTAIVLASLGVVPAGAGRAAVTFEEGVGPVRVAVERRSGAFFATLSLAGPVQVPAERPVRADVAASLSIPVDSLVDCWYASAGLPFCFAHLRDAKAVDAAVLDRVAWRERSSAAWSPNLFFFSGDPAPGSSLYARMFAPALGIDEDPATGSAAAALAAVLADRAPAADGEFRWRIDQGVALGRASRIDIAATKSSGTVASLHVGGPAVVVADGHMEIAPAR